MPIRTSRKTRTALDGAHIGLQCVACHTKPVADKIELSSRCADCHRRDDIHGGAFGQDCRRCHNTTSFARSGRGAGTVNKAADRE